MSDIPTSYQIGVDLGQVNDYTAIVVSERRELPTGRREHVTNVAAYFDGGRHLARVLNVAQVAGHYDLTHLERLPLGTPYTEVPGRLQAIARELYRLHATRLYDATGHGRPEHAYVADIALVVDQTGVGRPVVDLLREHGLDPISVTITGGDQVIRVAHEEYRVPKRNLASTVQTLLQTRRLRWAKSLPDAQTLRRELENFKAKISLSGHDSYGAGDEWREGNHDDLVLATALACWYGEQGDGTFEVMPDAFTEGLAAYRGI